MNKDNINKTIFWSLLYIVLYSIGIVTIVLYSPEFFMMAVGIVGVTYIIINLFFIPYFMVFAGTILQSITVKVLAKRDEFKGFPGTVFPFLCTVLAYLLLYYQGI